MMALTSNGIRIAINGSETDVDVENDAASWTTKIGNVKHLIGGGSWWRDPQPGVASLDVLVPLKLAHKIRTVTIAVTCIPNLAVPPTGVIGAGAANSYRIIFHGDVQAIKGKPAAGDTIVQVEAISEMSGLMNRKARTAASNNSGIRELLNDIETAHSLTMSGETYFPTIAQGFPNCDRPAQKGNSNGVWIRKQLAGTGVNMSEDWETSITAPALMWRPDWQDEEYFTFSATARVWQTEMPYPWLYSYPDTGMQYRDFVARVNVEGETSAGVEHYGYAQLSTSGKRLSVGQRDISVDTWIDTPTECQTQARRLMAYQAEPDYLKMRQVTYNTEHLYRVYTDDSYTDAEAQYALISLAGGMPGDTLIKRNPFGNSHADAQNWPAHAPAAGTLYDTLDQMWDPVLTYAAVSADTEKHVIRTIMRSFTPQGGWDVTLGVEPTAFSGLRGSSVTDYGNGTY
jgi:hypothetical protein